MRQGLYDILSKKCINTIKTNDPKESINIISNMKLPGSSNKIGKDSAFKIYKLYSEESVEYKSSEYRNNINSYKKKVNNNINVAQKYCKK
jgi:hypothetical protein